MLTACWPGKRIARSGISPWSLPKATSDPQKVTAPMIPDAATATEKVAEGGSPAPTVSRRLAPATRTDAPPPKPLKRATICGIPVIGTLTAKRAPIAEPASIPARITPKPTICRSTSVTATAISIPSAPRRFPRTAVLGWESPFRQKMKRTDAAR